MTAFWKQLILINNVINVRPGNGHVTNYRNDVDYNLTLLKHQDIKFQIVLAYCQNVLMKLDLTTQVTYD